jgi:hypothetical protein
MLQYTIGLILKTEARRIRFSLLTIAKINYEKTRINRADALFVKLPRINYDLISQVKGQAAYVVVWVCSTSPCNQFNHLTSFGCTPFKVNTPAAIITAMTLNKIKPPDTSKTALAGITDCNTIDNKHPTVAIKKTNGKPTTNKHTANVKVQIKKLLTVIR